MGALHGAGCLLLGLMNNGLLPLLGLAGGILDDPVPFGVGCLEAGVILGLQSLRLGLGVTGIGIEAIDFLLSVIDHLFHWLEEELLQHQEGNDHVAQGQKRCPEVHANKAFKSLHAASLLSFYLPEDALTGQRESKRR